MLVLALCGHIGPTAVWTVGRQCVAAVRAPAPSASAPIDHMVRWAHDAHADEFEAHRTLFAPTVGTPTLHSVVSDVTYWTSSIEVGHAGPDEDSLESGHLVHATKIPIVSVVERREVIEEAAGEMAAGRTSRFTYTAQSRIGEVHVSELPKAREWLARRLHDTLYPMIEERFSVDAGDLAVYDSLIIRYDASRGGIQQPMHRDASLISVNIALNGDYEGGGTRFESSGVVHTMAPVRLTPRSHPDASPLTAAG